MKTSELFEAKKRDYPKQDITPENILKVLPASPADILYQLGRPDSEYRTRRKTYMAILNKMVKDGLVRERHRAADDSVYHAV